MQYRYLCDVPYEQMKLDADYCVHAAAAAHLCDAIGHLDHTPPNPSWPENRYQFAFEGTSHGNLFEISVHQGPHANASVDSYMDDSDAKNIDRVGHRRWCLNPSMGKTGFGTFKGSPACGRWTNPMRRSRPTNSSAYPSPGLFSGDVFLRPACLERVA